MAASKVTVAVRGQTILWQATFLDQFVVAYVPTAAKIYIDYPSDTAGGRAKAEVSMAATAGANPWTGIWESAPAFGGTMDWSIRTMGASPVEALQGSVELAANRANPDST
jgi:hypothetical protein